MACWPLGGMKCEWSGGAAWRCAVYFRSQRLGVCAFPISLIHWMDLAWMKIFLGRPSTSSCAAHEAISSKTSLQISRSNMSCFSFTSSCQRCRTPHASFLAAASLSCLLFDIHKSTLPLCLGPVMNEATAFPAMGSVRRW